MTTRLGTFVPPPMLLREEIIQAFRSKILALSKDKPTHEARKKNTIKIKWKKN